MLEAIQADVVANAGTAPLNGQIVLYASDSNGSNENGHG
jgi:hypothetical protein